MTYISGIVNESDLTYLGGWPKDLQEMFGMEPVETDTLYPGDKNAVRYQNRSYELKDYATVLKLSTANPEGFYEDDFMRTRRL